MKPAMSANQKAELLLLLIQCLDDETIAELQAIGLRSIPGWTDRSARWRAAASAYLTKRLVRWPSA